MVGVQNWGVSILSNGEDWVVYDYRNRPVPEEGYRVRNYRAWDYKAFISEFEEIYPLLAFDAINEGSLDNYFSLTIKYVKTKK